MSLSLISKKVTKYCCSLVSPNANVRGVFKEVVAYRSYSSNVRQSFKGIFKLGLTGITLGALVGTGYSIHQMNKPRMHIINEEISIPLIEELPKIQPSRQVCDHKIYKNVN